MLTLSFQNAGNLQTFIVDHFWQEIDKGAACLSSLLALSTVIDTINCGQFLGCLAEDERYCFIVAPLLKVWRKENGAGRLILWEVARFHSFSCVFQHLPEASGRDHEGIWNAVSFRDATQGCVPLVCIAKLSTLFMLTFMSQPLWSTDFSLCRRYTEAREELMSSIYLFLQREIGSWWGLEFSQDYNFSPDYKDPFSWGNHIV